MSDHGETYKTFNEEISSNEFRTSSDPSIELKTEMNNEFNDENCSSDIPNLIENEHQYVRRPRTYAELVEVLQSMKIDEDVASNNRMELLLYCEGVKFYNILNYGEVTSSLEDSTLRIVKLGPDDTKNLDETIFLQIIKTVCSVTIDHLEESQEKSTSEEIEDSELSTNFVIEPNENDYQHVVPSFVYPLVSGVSHCYKTEYGAFILPDPESTDGGTIGFILPADVDQTVQKILIAFLSGNVDFGDLVRTPKSSAGDTVSSNIVKGATYISQGLINSAEKAGQYMNNSTPYLMSKINKAKNDAPPIPESLHNGIKAAKDVTGSAAKGVSFLSGKVGEATLSIGRYLAPRVRNTGSKILSTFGMPEKDANESMTDALKITAGAVEGFGTLYSGLESSATILGTHLSSNTVKIVEHSYGSQAGEVVETTLDTVGNLINVNKNLANLSAKGVIKSTGKNTGKEILEDLKMPKTYVNTEYIHVDSLFRNMNAQPSTSKAII